MYTREYALQMVWVIVFLVEYKRDYVHERVCPANGRGYSLFGRLQLRVAHWTSVALNK